MLKFYKYHGAGNDFIVIDDRNKKFNIKDIKKIKLLCHRRFGMGADGILLLRNRKGYDFEMVYMNSDGSRGAMCGNGGRCIVHFAHSLGLIKNHKTKFWAADGKHEAEILKNNLIKLKMQNVDDVGSRNGLPFVCQGTTPHNILYVKNLKDFPVVEKGRKIRYSDSAGVNVNFVEIKSGIVYARTYERGVEDETLACGTGATSVAIATHYLGKLKKNKIKIRQPGGELIVEFENADKGQYKNIYLTGPAQCVFEGEII